MENMSGCTGALPTNPDEVMSEVMEILTNNFGIPKNRIRTDTHIIQDVETGIRREPCVYVEYGGVEYQLASTNNYGEVGISPHNTTMVKCFLDAGWGVRGENWRYV